jgi:hypothetical protein
MVYSTWQSATSSIHEVSGRPFTSRKVAERLGAKARNDISEIAVEARR